MTSKLTPTAMTKDSDARGLITEVFEETALVLGGLVALHRVDDNFIWQFITGLDAVRCKAMRRVNESEPVPGAEMAESGPNLRPHPAIQDFLLKLQRP
jgi:hypothetical protein